MGSPYEYAVIFLREMMEGGDSDEMYDGVFVGRWGRLKGEAGKGIVLVQCLWDDKYSEEDLKEITEKVGIPAFSANGEEL